MVPNEHINRFMEQFPREGLTFDDVSIVTQYADFLPHETDVRSLLTKRIEANIPFVSAAMDTVTESAMAISMAMAGGIGIIHRNMSANRQARQVALVKHHLNGLIRTPVVFLENDTLEQVMKTRTRKGYGFSGFPICDNQGMVVGILTSADIKFARDPNAPVSAVMTREVISAPAGTTLLEAYEIMRSNRIGKLPLVARDGQLVGLYSYSDVRTLVEKEKPLFNRDSNHRLRVGAAIGPEDHKRVEALVDENVDLVVIDTAHGHSKGVIDMVLWTAKRFPELDIIAGDIATGEAALALRNAGAHAVKVGIGPGSICTTRVVAGVGIPQITAVYECAKALKGSLPIIADGGIRHSGDVPKVIAAGANTVMMGGLLAATDESPGEKIIHQGRQYVVYRGMGSLAAMQEGMANRERYGQSGNAEDELVPQGVEGIVHYAGSVSKVIAQFCGGLRAALGYSGCRTIADFHARGRFIRVTLAGVSEAHPHDVKILREAPNYKS